MRFWHFGSSPYLFFTLLLLFSIGAVVMYEPRFLGGASAAYNESIAYVELDRFSYYEVGTQGVLTHATGEKGYRFAHKDVIEGLFLAQFLPREQRFEQLRTDLGIRREEKLSFPKGVTYMREGSFSAQKGEYDLKRRYFRGEGSFEFTRAGSRAQGQNIRYDSRSGIIQAKDVKAVFLFQNGGER